MLSKSSIDRIGEKLRAGDINPETLNSLTKYQSEFIDPYKKVESTLKKKLFLEITGRPAKSTLSTIEKLRRIKSRLSQLQDMSGCRAIVSSLHEQDNVIDSAKSWFKDILVDDKRKIPTNGYRAVHLLIKESDRVIEVQVRTRIQHLWATISEKLSDTYGQEIKYGKGNQKVLDLLEVLSIRCHHWDLAANSKMLATAQLHYAKIKKLHPREIKEIKKDIKIKDLNFRLRMYDLHEIFLKIDSL